MKNLPAHKYYRPQGNKKRQGDDEGRKGGIDDCNQERWRDSPKSEEHGLLKIKSGICRLKKR